MHVIVEMDAVAFREKFRKKLIRLFLQEYTTRKERGELFFEGRWIRPEEKMDFYDDLGREHRKLWYDILLLVVFGFLFAVVLILVIKGFLFPK